MMALLSVSDLAVEFATEDGVVRAVDGVSFEVDEGETLGIVGESGCGKSVANLSLIGLTRAENASVSGSATFEGEDLISAADEKLRRIRGDDIAMIFQDPLSSLHPFYTVGDQLIEAIRTHREVPAREARERAVELLGLVGVPAPERRVGDYPHEFSGGMRQRAMIAMALANEPKLLIADEPTTALDVTTQAQIIQLLERLQQELGMAVIVITHDLGVIAETADRVLVMYAGRIVEQGTLDEIFYDPQHPYTWGLMGSLSRLDRPRPERLPQIRGLPPSLLAPPQGCHFRPRCPHAFKQCERVPPLESRLPEAPAHLDRCWLEPERKRSLREVEGRIGLEAPAA
ncbi:MAG: ABC transporter ATP-binding protein [Solirubrobacterales bacterium]